MRIFYCALIWTRSAVGLSFDTRVLEPFPATVCVPSVVNCCATNGQISNVLVNWYCR